MANDNPTPKKDVILTTGEKVAGMALAGGAVVAGGALLYKALPIINEIVWDGLSISLACALGGGVAYVAMDPDFRSIFGRAYRLGIRKLRRAVLTWDPIGNLELNIQHMERREQEMVKNRQALQAQISGLKRQIEKMREEMEEAIGTVKDAEADGQKVNLNGGADEDTENAATLAANAYGRREASVERLSKMLVTLESTAKTLKRIHDGVKFLIADTKDEVKTASVELAASTAAGDAADNAMDVIRGDPRLMQMYRESMQIIDDKVAERLGAVEMAVNDSKGFLATVDGKNKQYNKRALAALKRWDKGADQLRLNPNEAKVRVSADGDADAEAEEQAAAAVAQPKTMKADTDKLFD